MPEAPHFCTFCRCRFPKAPPQIGEMMANAQRVITELVEARKEIALLKRLHRAADDIAATAYGTTEEEGSG